MITCTIEVPIVNILRKRGSRWLYFKQKLRVFLKLTRTEPVSYADCYIVTCAPRYTCNPYMMQPPWTPANSPLTPQ
eukprot:9112387-Pyramimonas_sp.AAC.1